MTVTVRPCLWRRWQTGHWTGAARRSLAAVTTVYTPRDIRAGSLLLAAPHGIGSSDSHGFRESDGSKQINRPGGILARIDDTRCCRPLNRLSRPHRGLTHQAAAY